jgi:voltage-gated potassium channel
MTSSAANKSSLEQGGHRFLLGALLLMIIINPYTQQHDNLKWLISVTLVLVLLAAVRTVAYRRRQFTIAVALGLLVVVPELIELIRADYSYDIWQSVATVSFMFWVCALLLRDIVRRSHMVTLGLILGSINVYLMAAIGFANVYVLIEQLQPGSFTGLDQFIDQPGNLLYFSFVTLTTLGYGDISPITSYAMTATYLQAIFGQLYLVILVSRLVGMYVGRSLADPSPTDD